MNTQMLSESVGFGPELAASVIPFVDKLMSQMAVWGAAFAVTGMTLTGFLIWWIHRRRLLRRTPTWWNVAAKFSYLLVLVTIPMAGVAGGALFGAERMLIRAVDVGIRPLLEAEMPVFRASMVERFGPMTAGTMITVRDLVQPFVQDLTYKPQSDSLIESLKAQIVNEILLKKTVAALTELFRERMRNAGKIGAVIAKDWNGEYPVEQVIKFLSGAGERMDFSDLDKTIPEVVCEGVSDQIGAVFKGFYMTIACSLLAVIILIAGEMLFYFKRYLPRKQRLALPQSA